MVLDKEARGELEKYIDYLIKNIPRLMSRFREEEVKNILQFKNEEDFLYGVVYGGIIFGRKMKCILRLVRGTDLLL